MVKQLAASMSEDKKKIALLGGRLEGAVGQISKTQNALDQISEMAAADR